MITLAGTLLLPHQPTWCPAVAPMHGSLHSTREFYRIYADRFAGRGIAALIYDKRGHASATDDPESMPRERASDAEAAIDCLRERPEVDPGAAGPWAFSNGTWSAPQLAARLEEVAFMVVTGAVGVSAAATETHRKLVELRGWGIPAETLARVERGWELAYACLTGAAWEASWDAEYETLVASIMRDEQLCGIPLADYAVTEPMLGPIPPLVSAGELRAEYGSQAPDFGYDPAPDYERIACPVLVIAGADDPNLPAVAGARRVE